MINVSPRAICAARELLNLTQQQLAEACEVTNGTISRLESGASQPQAATIRKIVRELAKRGIEFTNGTGIGIRLDYKKAAAYKASLAEQLPVDGVD
jgi:transcriptional regulator with XRE-family HTH domain